MEVLRIGFLATRTPNFEPMTAFFRDVLGLKKAFAHPDWSGFTLPSGPLDLVEVYAPEKLDHRLLPDSVTGPVVAFIVDDVVSARAEVAAAGLELIGDIHWAAEVLGDPALAGFGWFFLRAPDGNVYVIEQTEPKQPAAPPSRE